MFCLHRYDFKKGGKKRYRFFSCLTIARDVGTVAKKLKPSSLSATGETLIRNVNF